MTSPMFNSQINKRNIINVWTFLPNGQMLQNHWISWQQGIVLVEKGTLLDELNRASGVAQSALTNQWKATQNETYLNFTFAAVRKSDLKIESFLLHSDMV